MSLVCPLRHFRHFGRTHIFKNRFFGLDNEFSLLGLIRTYSVRNNDVRSILNVATVSQGLTGKPVRKYSDGLECLDRHYHCLLSKEYA